MRVTMRQPKRHYGSRRRRRKSSGGKTFLVALVLFVMLCGLVLVFSGGASNAPARESTRDTGKHLVRVIGKLDKAGQALEQKNFGEAQQHLKKARGMLIQVLPEAGKTP